MPIEINGAAESIVGPIREALKAARKIFATKAEAEAGVVNLDQLMTPLRTAEAIAALAESKVANPPANGYILSSSAAGVRSFIPPASGLVSFTESLKTAAPNAASPVIEIAPVGSGIQNFCFKLQGGSSLLVSTPDNGIAGGAVRGLGAIDLQSTRISGLQVAKGAYSVIGGGKNNKTQFDNSVIGGGSDNTTGLDASTVSGGIANHAGAYYSFIGGGSGNFIGQLAAGACCVGGDGNIIFDGGLKACILGGYDNILDSFFSCASGSHAHSKSNYGAFVKSNGRFAVQGDAQKGLYVLRRLTLDATQSQLYLDGTTERFKVPDNSVYVFSGMVAARSSSGVSAGWRFTGTMKRGVGAASTVIVGTVIGTPDMDAGAVGWGLAIAANVTTGTLDILVTGATATTIRWVATLETCEVSF